MISKDFINIKSSMNSDLIKRINESKWISWLDPYVPVIYGFSILALYRIGFGNREMNFKNLIFPFP